MHTTPLLRVKNLNVSFNGAKPAVNGLDFELYRGETLAIVGESGSGKSVSTRAIMGLLPSHAASVSGEAWLHTDEKAVELLSARETALRQIRGNHIAMIFQEPMTALTPVLTIGEQLVEGILCHRSVSKREAYRIAIELLNEARIPEADKRMKQYPHQLSGGMRQRVMIAMALVCRPKILIADEPTTALDVTVQAQILTLMKALQEKYATAIILITHDMGVVAEVADRVLVMRRGDFIESGNVDEVFQAPKHPYTQLLLDSVPKLGSAETRPCSEKLQKVPLFSIDNLCVRFDIKDSWFGRVKARVHAVEQVSITLHPGETLALVGESGSGKSTLGRAMLNLVPTCSGSIRYRTHDITGWSATLMRPLRKEIQMIFQDPYASLNPRKTIGAAIAEPLKLFDICPPSERKDRVSALLERVGLHADDAVRYPHQFSGGQRQRICIARALACQPRVIVADECLSALDVTVQAQIIELLESLQQEFNLSLLFISHDLAVVEQISDRVAVMHMGRIVELGHTHNIIHQPQHPYTRRLLSAVPVADPRHASLTSRPLNTSEIPSPVRRVDEVIPLTPLQPVQHLEQHYIAEGAA